MSSNGFTPLDPDQGPTVWARRDESNEHTIEVVEGTDPTEPRESYLLSVAEIKRLGRLAESVQGDTQ